MGFNSVFRILQDVFPQIALHDVRLLRAVAVEHSEDANAAVEAVLSEVIPFLSEKSKTSKSLKNTIKGPNNAGTVVEHGLSEDLNWHCGISTGGSTSCNVSSNAFYSPEDALTSSQTDGAVLAKSAPLVPPLHHVDSGDHRGSTDDYNRNLVELYSRMDTVLSTATVKHSHAPSQTDEALPVGSAAFDKPPLTCPHMTPISDDDNDARSNTFLSEAINLMRSCQDSKMKITDNADLPLDSALEHENNESRGTESPYVHANCENFDIFTSHVIDVSDWAESNKKELGMYKDSLEEKRYSDYYPSVLPERVQTSLKNNLLMHNSDVEKTESYKLDSLCATDVAYDTNIDTSILELDNLVCDTVYNTVPAPSSQTCGSDMLEIMIEDARGNKKNMLSSMESVIALMKEAEARERNLESVKHEAAKAGLDKLSRAEDLKRLILRAIEANDMQAGEVYGEKAILETELKELESRLLNLSNDRDKSLEILDEMSQALEARLKRATEEMLAVMNEKEEKENSAEQALFEQELAMEKIVQESKILKQEAEKNAKMQEFLMDRGRVVDMLQGEMSVLCQDVKSLKEKFDNRVPLSESLSMTSCILASSNLSFKSLVSAADEELDQPDSPLATGNLSSEASSNNPFHPRVHQADNDTVEDGWEFFDRKELSA